MNAEPEVTNGTTESTQASEQGRKRTPPTRTLPTERLSPEKWQAALRAYAVVFESNGGKPVKNEEAGAIIGMAGATIVMTNAFYCDVKLLARQKEEQSFVPSAEAL